jgi:protein gp37
MGDKSNIEWTDATWNPIVGCSIVSPGCTNCYAMKMAARLQKMNRSGGSNSNYLNHYDGTTQDSKAGAVWTGMVALAPDKLFLKPLSWTRPRKVFVNSMGDLFHESIPDEWIDRALAVMALCPQHTFQVLTKRAGRMRDYCLALSQDCRGVVKAHCELSGAWIGWKNLARVLPLPNVWLGVSCERQQQADERIPLLLQTPAAIRFISAEPLLGPIDLRAVRLGHMPATARLDWVIAGGESGHNARPMHQQWVRDIRDQCRAAGVSFFFKQWAAWMPAAQAKGLEGEGERLVHLQKNLAGRQLDGREWNEFPQVRA